MPRASPSYTMHRETKDFMSAEYFAPIRRGGGFLVNDDASDLVDMSDE